MRTREILLYQRGYSIKKTKPNNNIETLRAVQDVENRQHYYLYEIIDKYSISDILKLTQIRL